MVIQSRMHKWELFSQLFSLMGTQGTSHVNIMANGKVSTYVLSGWTRESGCGRSFILHLTNQGKKFDFLVKTLD
jgi:hypothetical protein